MKVSRPVLAALAVLVGVALVALTLVAVSPDRPAPGAPAPAAPATSPTATTAPPLPAREARVERPNIVVVMADDMRADDLQFAPAVRRLVGRTGVTFANSFSPYPLCCPARASFLTGTYAHNHRVYWHEPPSGYGAFDDSRTLATSLRARGYRTGFIGKYLNRYGLDTSRVSGRPSHTYVPRGWDEWRAAVENPGGLGFSGGTYDYLDTPFNVDGRIDDGYGGRYQTDVIGDFSVGMARRLAARRAPFLMYVNYVAPHVGEPVEADDTRDVRNDDGDLVDLRSPARPAWVRGRFDALIPRGRGLPRGGGPAERDVRDKPSPFADLPEVNAAERRGLRDLTRQRAESIYVMDRQVARLVRELRRSGAWSDTVLVFTSDNGYFLGEHRQRSGKVRAHEPSLRVPLLVTGPGLRRGATSSDPVTTVDLTATLLDLAGARPPRRLDGRSVADALRDGDQGWLRPVLTEATHTGGVGRRSPGFAGPRTSIGVRTGRYSYVRNRAGTHELYDLWRDPLQLRNVYGERSYRADQRLLQEVWWRLRNCRGAGCRVRLPESLQLDAASLGRRTRAYWRAVDRTYGYR
ncbi:sulfatase family protein [Nocardioides dongkuii]|uniref:sulfatase family protein n=1 Tax=Nocardioides dongkuii TaxID=2760089 RepID=UPI0015FE310B|nr:sulfatase [Nocardioides dongkuii]